MQQLARERVDFQWETTRTAGGATQLAAEIPEGYVAVAVGGDGTIHEMIAGLPTGRTIGVIPAGRGNDFARTVGISQSPQIALRQLLRGAARPIDLPFVNGRPFLNVASVGFDAHVAQKAATAPGRGAFPYIASFLTSLAHLRPHRISIEWDGRHTEGEALLLAVGNCRYYAGGMRICPHAHFDDGLLDVVIAGRMGKWESLVSLIKLMRGTHLSKSSFHHTKAHSLVVDGPKELCIQADGEIVGHLPATFTLKHHAMRVVVASGSWIPSKVTSIRQRLLEAEKTQSSQ